MHSDQTPFRVGLDERYATDRQAMDDARILSRGAIINWLWAHNPNAESPMAVAGIDTGKPTSPGTRSGVTVILGEDEDAGSM